MPGATFGDFACAARTHLDIAAADATVGGEQAVEEVTGGLLRISTVMARYLSDISTAFTDVPPSARTLVTGWARATIQAQEALGQATSLLGASAAPPSAPGDQPAVTPLARGLYAAAASMTAARDLLHTHFSPGPGGERLGRPRWALVVTSPPVTRALLGEIAILARNLAPPAGALAIARGPGLRGTGESRHRLHAASQYLWSVHAAIQAAHQRDPVSADDRRLLHAIPVSTPQPRCVPDGTETIPGLCAGIISTAERIRYAAPIPPNQAIWDPGLTITSLRQVAATSTVTAHHCHILLRSLAARAAQGRYGQISLGLAESAAAAGQARTRWLHAAGALDQVTTDVRRYLSPAAAEAGDLALWTGRLAYADPRWTLSSGPSAPARPPEQLAAEPDDIPAVVAAAHHAAHTLSHLARTELRQTRSAAEAGRILVPTRTLPESDGIARRYTTAPPTRISQLLSAYQDADTASVQTTAAIAAVAETVRAPSRLLAQIEAAADGSGRSGPRRTRNSLPDPALGSQPATGTSGTMQEILHGMAVTSPDLLRRASAIDRAREQLISDATLDRTAPQEPALAAHPGGSEGSGLPSYLRASADPGAAATVGPPRLRQPEQPEIEP